MALAHQINRHSRSEDHEEDPYVGPDMTGVEVIAAGSVTSFVRKLFQMVQGECDSVVGFVADGTAFEVKDPRRLEQDILPKYFRHSRFQSLVRQLNFYSFKKISKERSVWIYKHAFFRRDEPELLHALKRKTNQHGAPGRIGGAGGGGGGIVAGEGSDDAGLDRPMAPSNLSHDAHDNNSNKPRPRGPSLSRLPNSSSFSPQHHHHHHHHHHTSPSSFNNGSNGRHQSSSGGGRQQNQHQNHYHHQNHHQHQHHEQQHHQQQQSSRPQQPPPPHHHQHHLSSPNHAGKGRSHLSSNSRGGSAGGGPSTGGVGGAAVPSYGGQGPSSRVPGFAWSGAGGRPVSAGGGASPDYADCAGDGSGNDGVHCGGRGGGWASSPNHHDSHDPHNNHHSHNQRHHNSGGDGDESSAHRAAAAAAAMAPSHGYRNGPAMGDTGGGDDDAGNDDDHHGGKRRTGGGGSAATNAAAATSAAAVEAYAATSAAGAGASAGTDSSGRDQASALWGLSALCQVASATEEPADEETRHVRGSSGRSPRAGLEGEDRHPKRPCVEDGVGGMRRGWGSAGGGGGRSRGGEGSSEEDEGEEDGITSAERDDSSASFHSRSPSSSSCGSSRSSNGDVHSARGGGSPRHSIPDHDHDGVVVTSVGNGNEQGGGNDNNGVEGEGSTLTTGAGIAPYTTSGSRGVFCPTWDWGRAACEPAIRLPGSFVDRRGEREGGGGKGEGREQAVGQNGPAEGFEMEVEEDEESSKTEGEDIDDEDDHETVCAAKEVHERATVASSGEVGTVASSVCTSAGGDDGTPAPLHSACPRPRDLEADIDAEAAVGLEGIGAMFAQFSSGGDNDTDGNGNASDFLATVTNSDDGGLREMAVFCAGPAGQAPDVASPASLARLVSSFLQSEEDVADDLRVYAEALDPAAVDVVVTGRAKPSLTKRKAKAMTNTLADSMADPTADPKQNNRHPHQEGATNAAAAVAAEAEVMEPPAMGAQDGAKLLRVFCRYAACRLGRALEVASCASAPANATASEGRSGAATAESQRQEEELRHRFVARRVSPRLDECRWKWWRAAVRFS